MGMEKVEELNSHFFSILAPYTTLDLPLEFCTCDEELTNTALTDNDSEFVKAMPILNACSSFLEPKKYLSEDSLSKM